MSRLFLTIMFSYWWRGWRTMAIIASMALLNTQCGSKSNNVDTWEGNGDELKMPVASLQIPEMTRKEKASIINSPYIRIIHQALKHYFNQLATTDGINGTMLVAYKGIPIFEGTHGFADIPGKKLIDTNTTFHLASVSKTFTAVAILYLYENQYLRLDDAVQQYLPGFPYTNITIRMLLDHRSGLPDYTNWSYPFWPGQSAYAGNLQVLSYLHLMQPPLLSVPGTTFNYCNTNYALLACIIETVSDMSYSAFMQKFFFKPLDMKHTYVWTPLLPLPINQSLSHDILGQPIQPIAADGVIGDKNIYSTTHDMLIWDKMLRGKSLSNATKQLMFAGDSHEQSGIKNYGLGWRIYNYPDGKKIVYHTGWWQGNNIVYYRFLNDDMTLIILSNKYNPAIFNIWPFFDILHLKEPRTTDDDWVSLQ